MRVFELLRGVKFAAIGAYAESFDHTLNHRLNLFGYLYLAGLAGGKFADSGNSRAVNDRWGSGVMADEMKAIQRVKPELVAQIRFVEWTAEGRLRHAAEWLPRAKPPRSPRFNC